MKRLLFLLLLVAPATFAQTSVTGRWGVGAFATRPAACGSGDTWTDTDDANSYKCFPNGTWNTISGGGGGTPGGGNGDVQLNIGGTFGTVSKFNYNSTNNALTMPFNVVFQGANPYVDVTTFGVRAIASFSTTATCNSGSPTVTLGAASNFINGDGIMLLGCGVTNTMTTPVAPSVTPSLNQGPTGTGYTVAALTGATTNQYQIVANDGKGGFTAAGTVTSISTANALGPQTVSITSATRSNNVTTFNVASGTQIQTGATICTLNVTEPSGLTSFDGCWPVASTPSGTQLTITSGEDTRSGSSAAATSNTGTLYYFQNNHVCWSAVAGAFNYLVYGRASGSMALIGITRPGEVCWDDYGSTMSTLPASPSWFPTAPPGSATNDYLVTTILSGGTTTTLTIATNALNTMSALSSTALFDNAPNLKAAFAAASGSGGTPAVARIPTPAGNTGYVLNSSMDISSISFAELHVQQAGLVILNQPMVKGQSLMWEGIPGTNATCGAPAFSWTFAACFSGTGYPLIQDTNAQQTTWSGIEFEIGDNGLGYNSGGGGSAFFNTFTNSNFLIGTSAANYMGMAFASYGNTQQSFRFVGFKTTSGTVAYKTLTPAVYLRNNLGNTLGPGSMDCDHCSFNGQGVAVIAASGAAAAGSYSSVNGYTQGNTAPMWTFQSGNTYINFTASGFINDTSSTAFVANYGTVQMQVNLDRIGQTATNIVTGNVIPDLRMTNTFATRVGQTYNITNDILSSFTEQGAWASSNAQQYTDKQIRENMHMPAQHQFYIDLAAPSSITATVAAGGSIPVGTWTYLVQGVAADTYVGQSGTNASACVTSAGNQTCNEAWSALAGATAYNVFRSNGGGYQGVIGCQNITVLTCADTNAGGNGTPPNAIATGGISTINSVGLFSPGLVLTTPSPSTVSFTGTIGLGTLTASRSYTITGDANGNICSWGTFCDVKEIAAPSNPAAGFERWYANSTTHLISCLTSGGGNCSPGGGGGPTLKTNSVNNSDQTVLNLINSTTNATGLAITDTNTSGGIVQAEISGTVNLASGGCGGSSATTCFNNISLMTTLGDLLYGGAGGAETRLQGPGVGTSLVYVLEDIPSGGSATAEQWGILGVPVPATQTGAFTFSGAGAAGTLAAADQLSDILANPSAPQTYTIPATSALNFNNNPAWSIFNENASNTITYSSSSTIIGDTVALPLWQTRITQQAGSSSYIVRSYPSMGAWGSTCTTKAIQWSTTSGILCNQLSLTTGVSGILPLANGGTNASNQQGALNNINPSAIRTGDIVYFNGANWVNLGGNNAGTQFLSENGSGVPSWSSGTTTTPLQSVTAALGSATIANANFPITWNWAQTTAAQYGFTLGETAAKTGAGGGSLLVQTQAGSTGIPITAINSLTGSQTLAALTVTPTWNTTGVVDAGILENVTNTASGAASLLMDLQVGGSSKFKVDKAGLVNGLAIPAAAGSATFAQLIASGTAAMGTSAISSGTCATVVTSSATGVATTDTIKYTPNTDPTAVTGYGPSATGSLYIWAYPTSNNVNFKVCNNTSASITPSALTFNWEVTR